MEKKKTEKVIIYLAIVLLAISTIFILLEHYIHWPFFGHLAAIPLEILVGAFLVERFLARREKQTKLHQLMHIKSYLFRSEMRNLYIENFNGLKYPEIDIAVIKNSSLDELKKMRQDIETREFEYKDFETLEKIVDEYVNAQKVFQLFMEWAIANDFEEIFEDMIFIMHFIQDVQLFKKNNPQKLFVLESKKNPNIRIKLMKVVTDGIKKFLDYSIELQEKNPVVFNEILTDYLVSSRITSS